jgi:magnesium transporter
MNGSSDDGWGGGGDVGAPSAIRILARPVLGQRTSRELPEEDLEGALEDGEVLWVDLADPGSNAAPFLSDRLRLGSLTVEDCLLPLRMPKFDPLPEGGAFVAAFAINLEGGSAPRLRTIPVPLVIGSTYLVTVRRHPMPEDAARIEAALRRDGELPEQSGAALAHAALDALIDRHLPVMLRAAEAAEELEDDLDPRLRQESLVALERLIVLRRDLLAFRRLGVAQQEVLRRLGRAFPSMQAYLADVADNQREAVDTAIATCDYIDGAIDAFRVRRDMRADEGIRRLTVLAGILGPLTVMIGLWGVNFQNIPGTDTRWGWSVFVATQVCFVLLAAWYFRRRGLL